MEDGSGFYARIPDLPGCISTGRNLQDAITQITDAASIWLVIAEDKKVSIATPTPQTQLPVDKDSIFSLIDIDTLAYRAKTDSHAVRKNVSLPAWMATMADMRGINCSQVLQDALRVRLES